MSNRRETLAAAASSRLVIALTIGLLSAGTALAADGSLSISGDGATVTVAAHGATVVEVLEALGARAGFAVERKGDLSSAPIVDGTLTGSPTTVAIRLLADLNHVMIYKAGGKGGDRAIERILVRGSRANGTAIRTATVEELAPLPSPALPSPALPNPVLASGGAIQPLRPAAAAGPAMTPASLAVPAANPAGARRADNSAEIIAAYRGVIEPAVWVDETPAPAKPSPAPRNLASASGPATGLSAGEPTAPAPGPSPRIVLASLGDEAIAPVPVESASPRGGAVRAAPAAPAYTVPKAPVPAQPVQVAQLPPAAAPESASPHAADPPAFRRRLPGQTVAPEAPPPSPQPSPAPTQAAPAAPVAPGPAAPPAPVARTETPTEPVLPSVRQRPGETVKPPQVDLSKGAPVPVDGGDRRKVGDMPPTAPVEPLTDNPGAVWPATRQMTVDSIPIPDRWRLVDALGIVNQRWYDPYNQNVLKADKPIFGDDWFFNLGIISDTVIEPRTVPTPIGAQSTARSLSLDSFGRTGQLLVNQNIIASFSLIQGDTAYKPPDIELRVTPVFNVNHTRADEVRLLNADPTEGTTRTDGHVGLQEAFLDYHLRNVSDRFDFDSIRVGIQPFSSDFRGFLFQDNQLGVRLFGDRDNNRWQYNLAYFRRLEKDTNSGLNDVGQAPRADDVFLANLYRQDFPVLGMTTQGTVAHNRNQEGSDPRYFDNNKFQARPASIGDQRPRDYDVTYLGLNMDGHFGRFNLTGSFYYALGEDSHNQFTGKKDASIGAFFGAAEGSMDFDWTRVRVSGLYASGDDNPNDNHEGGFDAIFENPQFAGADNSYWIRQGIPLIGGGLVGVKGRNSVLPALRSSKEQGQSNFNNPGVILVGTGADFDLLPELRLSTDINHLWFDNTSSLERLRQQGHIDRDIGTDVSIALTWRPHFTQNVVGRLSAAALVPGEGFNRLFGSQDNPDAYYSVLANLILTY